MWESVAWSIIRVFASCLSLLISVCMRCICLDWIYYWFQLFANSLVTEHLLVSPLSQHFTLISLWMCSFECSPNAFIKPVKLIEGKVGELCDLLFVNNVMRLPFSVWPYFTAFTFFPQVFPFYSFGFYELPVIYSHLFSSFNCLFSLDTFWFDLVLKTKATR